MLTKSVNSVISVGLKHVAKKSVQSVRSVSSNIRMVSPDSNITQNTQERLTPTLHLLQKGVSLSLKKQSPTPLRGIGE